MAGTINTPGFDSPPCPGDELLRQVCLGEAAEDVSESVLAHVETCPVCPHRMDAIWANSQEAQDSFLMVARRFTGNSTLLPNPTPSTPSRGLNRLKAQADTEFYDLGFLPPSPNRNCLGRLGRYDLMQVLGSGGMGIVFQAWDCVSGQHVAVKTLLGGKSNNRRQIERFLEEAKVTGRIQHAGVLPILDRGKDRGIPYFVMPLLSGCNLHQLIHEHAPLEPERAVRLMRQALEALQAAHRAGVLHRDIKPSNLWLKCDPVAGETLYLLDFGLATQDERDERLTATGAILGTPAYLSPEQGLGVKANITPASDLFSQGCVFYELLSGKRVFPGDNALEIAGSMVRHQIKPLKILNPKVPQPLSDLVMRLLAKSPGQRPQSAAQVLQEMASPGLLRDPLLTRRQLVGTTLAAATTLGTIALGLWKYRTWNRVPSLTADSIYNLKGSVSFALNKVVPLNEGPRMIYGTDPKGNLWAGELNSGSALKLAQFDLQVQKIQTGIATVVVCDQSGSTQAYDTRSEKVNPAQPNPFQGSNYQEGQVRTHLLWTGNFDRFICAYGNSLWLVESYPTGTNLTPYKQQVSVNALISSLFINFQSSDTFRPFGATTNHGWLATFGLPDIQIYDRPAFLQGFDFRICTKPTGVAMWTNQGELIFQRQMNDLSPSGKMAVQPMEGWDGHQHTLLPERILYGPNGDILVLHGNAGERGHVILVNQARAKVAALLEVEDPIEIQVNQSDLWVLDRAGMLHRFDLFEKVAKSLD